jgi:hypothetical protein
MKSAFRYNHPVNWDTHTAQVILDYSSSTLNYDTSLFFMAKLFEDNPHGILTTYSLELP